jgi:hypothetical protein
VIFMSRRLKAGQNHNTKVTNKYLENAAEFRYVINSAANQNYIHEYIKSRFNSGNVCYHSVENIFFCLLRKSIKIEIHTHIIFPVVLRGCESWSFVLKEGHRLRGSENRVLQRTVGLKKEEVTSSKKIAWA